MTNKVIATTTYARPHYLREVLDTVGRCSGVGQYMFVVAVDPSPDETIKDNIRTLVEGIRFCKCIPLFNKTRMGINENTFRALSVGFQLSDYVIYFDEDVVLGPDALRYFEYCNRFRDDPSIFNITALCNRKCESRKEYLKTDRRKWFTPGGFATWQERIMGHKGIWGPGESWDVRVNTVVRGDRYEIYPLLARSKNIGVIGEHTPSREFFNKYCLIQSWSGDEVWSRYASDNAGMWQAAT